MLVSSAVDILNLLEAHMNNTDLADYALEEFIAGDMPISNAINFIEDPSTIPLKQFFEDAPSSTFPRKFMFLRHCN